MVRPVVSAERKPTMSCVPITNVGTPTRSCRLGRYRPSSRQRIWKSSSAPAAPHCDAAKPFLLDLQRERPSLRITVYDLAQDPAARQRLPATARPSTSEVSQTCREESSRLADEFRRGLQANIGQDIEHLLLGQLAAKSMHRAEENSVSD